MVLIKHVLPSPNLLKKAKALLKQLDIEERANEIVEAVIPNLSSKEMTVVTYVEHLGLQED